MRRTRRNKKPPADLAGGNAHLVDGLCDLGLCRRSKPRTPIDPKGPGEFSTPLDSLTES
jgi:hypothetical protein